MIVNNCLNKGNITINGSSVNNFIDGIIAHPSGSSNDDVTIILQNASYNLGTITAPKSKTTFVRYDVNGSIGNIVPLRIAAGTNITISDGSSLVREGYVFNGWNTKIDGTGDAYAGGEQLKIESALTLYAQWRREKSTWSVLAPPPAFYTGSPIKPKVVVYDENDSLLDIDKYVVTYQDDFDCIDVGRKTIKVTYNNEEIEVETITNTFSYDNTLDTQPYFNSKNMTKSTAKFGTITINITLYLVDNEMLNRGYEKMIINDINDPNIKGIDKNKNISLTIKAIQKLILKGWEIEFFIYNKQSTLVNIFLKIINITAKMPPTIMQRILMIFSNLGSMSFVFRNIPFS